MQDEDDEEPVASTSQVPDPDTQEQLRINKSRRQRINSKLQRPRRREDGETKARQRRLIPRLSPRKHDDKRRDVEESIIDLPSSHNAHQLHLRRVEVPDDGLEGMVISRTFYLCSSAVADNTYRYFSLDLLSLNSVLTIFFIH